MKCPYCAEQVKDEAVVCRYCHRDLTSIRLNEFEKNIGKILEDIEDKLSLLNKRVEYLESNKSVAYSFERPTTSIVYVYILALLIGGILPAICVYIFLTYNLAVFLLLPFVVLIGLGIWVSFLGSIRAIKHQALIGLCIGFINYVGIQLVILNVVYDIAPSLGVFLGLLLGKLYSDQSSFLHNTLFLILTPFFLVMLGSFIGEWIESKKLTGRQMNYPREIAEQIIKLYPEKRKSNIDPEKLSNLIAAIAPLITAIGGIVVPIVTLLYSQP